MFYQVLVEKKGSKNSWRTIIDETKVSDFFIEKNGDMAIIKMEQPETFRKIYLEKGKKDSSGTFNDAKGRLENYLKKHGTTSTGFFGLNKTLRYKEGIVAINEIIAVKGIANWKHFSTPIEGYNYSKIVTLSGSKDKNLLITDLREATIKKKKF